MKKYILLVLSTILVISISCLPTLAYFSNSYMANGEIKLGSLDFSIRYSPLILSSIMPGDRIETNISILNARNNDENNYQGLVPFYIRFNLNLTIDGKDFSDFFAIFSNESTLKSINDTYYHMSPIDPGKSLNMLESVLFETYLGNDVSGKDINLILNIEAIQATKEAVLELWPEIYNYI